MKQRLDELTILRAIACLSVIMVHVTAVPFNDMSAGNTTLLFFGFLNRAFKYTTPTFVFLSGFIQYYGYWKKPFHMVQFLKKRFGPIFWPYVIATLLYFGLQVGLGSYSLTILGFVKRLLLADANYHLYFVAIILQLYVVMPLLMRAFHNISDHKILLAALIINLVSKEFVLFNYSDRFFMNYLFFFVMGMYAVRHLEHVREIATKYIVVFGMIYGGVSILYGYQFVSSTLYKVYWNPHVTSLTWFVFSTVSIIFLYSVSLMTVGISIQFSNWTQRISAASYWIYLIHPMVLYIAIYVWKKIGVSSTTIQFIWNSSVVFGITLLFLFHYGKIKNCYQIITTRKSRSI